MPSYAVDLDDDRVERAGIFFEDSFVGGDFDGSWSPAEDVYYEVIREALSPEYRGLSDDEVDDLLEGILAGMSPEEVEGFWSTVGNLGKSIAAQVVPVAAPLIGTAIGGPVGGAIGGMVGQAAGQALGGPRAPQKPAAGPPAAPVAAPAGAPAPVPAGGSSATAQLMWLLQNPALLQSLLGQVLGPPGLNAVPVGQQGKPAPFGAFMNTVAELANQAAMEANSAQAGAEETPYYLLDSAGNFRCDDPAVPEERARVLLEQLREEYFAEAYDGDDEGYLTEADDDDENGLVEWLMEAGLVEAPARYLRHRHRHRRHRREHHRRPRGTRLIRLRST